MDPITRVVDACRLRGLSRARLLAGCDGAPAGGRDVPPDTAEAARAPVRGGTAVIGMYVELRTMNPFGTLPDVNKALERYALFTPLIVFDAQQRPQPWLAAAWDTVRVAPDSLELTFRLRHDVRWHDGQPVTSADVAFTFERAKDPRTGYVDMAAFAPYSPRVLTPDPYTVVLRLRVHPDFLEPWFLLPPLPRHVLGDVPPEQLVQHPFGTSPVGSGPFRFVRRRPGNDWVFEANPDFPAALGGRPYLDRLVYRTIPEQTGLLAEVLTGRVDIALSIRPAQVAQLRASPELRVLEVPSANWVFLGLNARLPFFDTRAERQAIRYALDRKAIVDGIMGGFNVLGRATVTPVHWAFDSTDAALAPVPDPAQARRLLEQSGWQDRDGDGIREDAAGRPFRFPLMVWQGGGSYQEMAEVIQAQLREVGVAVSVRVLEFNTFVARIDGTPPAAGAAARPVPGALVPGDVRARDFAAAIGDWTDSLRKDASQ
ncbi:MAG: hypothetical protein FIB01_11235, partial [Gemmatimonadetes bacterium]|nr:hypothetical protein [Gemmatimonadota bacterium]